MSWFDILGWIYLIMCIVDVAIYRRDPPWRETWDFYFGPVYMGVGIIGALWFFEHDRHFMAGLMSGIVVAQFYLWWRNNRRRRKKVADKASGMIVDVGGRLKVVRIPIEGT